MPHPPTDPDGTDPGPGPRTTLSREVVLRAALAIVDQHGVEKLSMRRLGHAVDRDPMAVYRYAPNKAAILDGITELVLSQLHVDTTDTDWTSQLRSVAHQYRRLTLAHPNTVPLLVTRPLATPLGLRPPGTLRPLEDFLELLTRAGFPDTDALHIYRSFSGLLNGHALNELQEIVDNPEETDDLLRLGLHRLPIREFPRIRALATTLATYDGHTELDRSLDILLTGLHTQLHPAHRPHH